MSTTAQLTQQKETFLTAFAKSGVVLRACEDVGVPRRTVYGWLHTDPTFTELYRTAELESIEVLEKEMLRRGVEGYDKPVYQQGKKVGVVREYSDTLLIFALKARAPDRYRENRHVTVEGTMTLAALVAEVVAARE